MSKSGACPGLGSAPRAALGFLVTLVATTVTVAADEPRPAPDHAMSAAWQLRAGPVRLKLQDGELRYLRVGGKEIVRRIYFAVRDGAWQTAMPRFTKMDVREGDGGFSVHLAADCR